MAVYDHEEEEQLEDLKAWWGRYGAYITAAVCVCAIIFAGTIAYRYWQDRRAESASVLYFAVVDSLGANDTAKADAALKLLQKDYGSTGYAPRAAFLTAAGLWDDKKPADAVKTLQWIIDNAKEKSMVDIAQFRLANVYIEQKKFSDAATLLNKPHDAAFDMLYAESLGDALMGEGKKADAIRQYQIALGKILPQNKGYRTIIKTKLDAATAK
jgi:predicted negative regulator of RcsB-dependent stress response